MNATTTTRPTTHIRLQFKPTRNSRIWHNSSLTMWAAGRENMEISGANLARFNGWHAWQIVECNP